MRKDLNRIAALEEDIEEFRNLLRKDMNIPISLLKEIICGLSHLLSAICDQLPQDKETL